MALKNGNDVTSPSLRTEHVRTDGAVRPKGKRKKLPVAVKAAAPTKTARYYASIYPGQDHPVPQEFATFILTLENIIGMPIWLVIQNDRGPWSEVGYDLFKGFQGCRSQIPTGKPLALLVDSPGGDAHYAYRIARMLQRRTENKLTVIVPQYAKSAATLLALGATDLILGRDAELGPLDVQMYDREREAMGSALNAVQSLERLNAFSMKALDQTMMLLTWRTAKRTDILLPHVLEYIASFLRPLLEKIDTLDYTKQSRELKVAEEYAVRLMRMNYPWATAKRIAGQLVEKYPTHGFVIDADEASIYTKVGQEENFGLGLKPCKVLAKMEEAQAIMEKLIPFLDSLIIAGRLMPVRAQT